MRFTTVFVSSAFVLAGMSATLPRKSENILVARFADSDFLAEVDARANDEEPEPYAQGGVISTKNHKSLSATSRYSEYDMARGYVLARDGSGGTPPYTSHYRRSFYESPRYLTRRHQFSGWGDRHIPDGRPGTSSSGSSPPTTPTTPGFFTPPILGSPSSRASTPVSNWRDMPPIPNPAVLGGENWHQAPVAPPTPGIRTPSTPGSPGSSRPNTPGWRRVPSSPGNSRPSSPGNSRPSSPDSSRPSSPEWHRVPNGRSYHRRSFYDLD